MSDLKIKVLLEAIDKISEPMRRMAASFKNITSKMKENLDKVGKSMTDLGAKISIGLSAPLAAFGALAISKSTQFEKLGASLETVTGSATAARIAMNDLIKFSSTTPFQLEEVVGSFIKLKALGLDPSMEALKAYGNVASAMGKSLDQFIEAIADAATGEFERLKEFGIKASSQGNQVAFTFQGQTKVVKKNATEIEKYLRSIGQVQFAGAMDRQMDTLGGSFSNLEDAVSTSMAQIGQQLSKTFQLKDKIAALTTTIVNLAAKFESLPEPIKTTISYAALFIAVLGPALMIIGQIVIGIGGLVMGFGMVAPAIIPVIGAIKAMSVALLTTPFGWIVLGIAALIGAGYLLVRNWDKIKAIFVGIWEGMKLVFQANIDWYMQYITPLLNAISAIKNGISKVLPSGGKYEWKGGGQPLAVTPVGRQSVDMGGTIKIKVDSEGRAKVTEATPNRRAYANFQVNTGEVMSGGY